MNMTPLDIRQKRFEISMRGYARREVEGFLELTAAEFEDLVKENISLKEDLKRTMARLEQHLEREKTLQETMVTAQRISEDVKQQARKEGEVIVAQSELTAALEKTLAEVRTLRGLIRICAWCKHIHADGEWQQVERFVSANSHAEFTHGICPACLADQVKPATASPGSGSCSP